ncbi:hypothetical protein ACQ5SB_12880 [Stenotrophomonas geniculata]|uniref:hypothetical protein n=1 Tax=Stenotrophomonas TaxID=40323 RepID=UPI0020971262|nr:hypothetical protein [Stenotrophomonas maltophilia]MCO7461957.1 hypothetical protein [Stenotrophomonas maltophilia]
MKIPTIVIHSDPEDVVATELRDVEGVSVIHLDELTQSWCVQEAEIIEPVVETSIPNMWSAYIINRVFDLSCTEIGKRLRAFGLHENWAHTALGSVLSRAHALAHGIGPRGVSRSLLPLNVQWKLLSERVPGIKTPRFAFGFGHRMPDMSHLDKFVQKSVWSYFRWDGDSDVAEGEQQWHPFFVEQPQGIPIICSYHGDVFALSFPRGRPKADLGTFPALIHACRELFDSRMGEILVYQEDEILTFCACSPYMAGIGELGEREQLLLQGVPSS